MKIYSIHNLVPHIIIKWSSHLLAKILYGYSSNPEKYSISKFNPNSTNFEEHTYDYSNLPLKYASWLSAQFFWQKLGFILYCLNMSCKVICHKFMNFLCLTFNVTLLTFQWNISNDCWSSPYICPTSVWTSEQSNWSSMLRTVLYRASKPLKSIALLDS